MTKEDETCKEQLIGLREKVFLEGIQGLKLAVESGASVVSPTRLGECTHLAASFNKGTDESIEVNTSVRVHKLDEELERLHKADVAVFLDRIKGLIRDIQAVRDYPSGYAVAKEDEVCCDKQIKPKAARSIEELEAMLQEDEEVPIEIFPTGEEMVDVGVLMVALYESVKLQSHYAKLLNVYDRGKRRSFSSAGAWIARLKETGTIKTPQGSIDSCNVEAEQRIEQLEKSLAALRGDVEHLQRAFE